jgi:ubiquitin-conjugating enzyme E2 M
MIKLFSLKQQKKDGESTPKVGNQKKASAAQLRITKGKTGQAKL